MEEWFENYGRLPLRARNSSMDLECYEPNYRVAEMEFRNEDINNFMEDGNYKLYIYDDAGNTITPVGKVHIVAIAPIIKTNE